MKRRLTASQIVSLLFYKQNELMGLNNVPEWILNEGKRIHDRLNFNQVQQFSRYLLADDNQWWLIVGCPDRIDWEKGIVKELKTYHSYKMPPYVLEVAKVQVQIYCWLSGLPKWEVWGYSSYTNKLSKKAEGEVNEELVYKMICKAIKLQKIVNRFAKVYQKIAGG